MKKLFLQCIWIFFSSVSLSCLAFSSEEFIVENGFVRATIPGTSISSAYMTMNNLSNKLVTLTGVSSSVSDRVEIHDHVMVNNLMRMQQRQSVNINANSQVILQSSGLHLMIFNLEQPLLPEDTIDITLHFSHRSDVTITLPVQSIKQEKKSHHHHH